MRGDMGRRRRGALLFLGWPTPAMLPWLAGAVALHSVYSLVLTRSYTLNDFSVAFPIARGTAPLVAVGASALLFGEIPGLAETAGVIAISAGILSLSAGGRIGRTGLIAALTAGVLTAAYTVVDAGGMRSSDGVLPFLCWFFFATGSALLIQFRLTAGAAAATRLRRDLRPESPRAPSPSSASDRRSSRCAMPPLPRSARCARPASSSAS